MINLQDDMKKLAGEYWDMCERVTGKDESDWNEVWRNRRERGLGGNTLTSRKTYTMKRISDLCHYYGLDFDDYVEQVHVPLNTADEKTQWEKGAEKAGWPGQRKSGFCDLVFRYRFLPEKLIDLGKQLERESGQPREGVPVPSESTQAPEPMPTPEKGGELEPGPLGLPF